MRFKLKEKQEVEVIYQEDTDKFYVKSDDLSSFDCFIASNEVDQFCKYAISKLIDPSSVEEITVRQLQVTVRGNGLTEKIGLGEIRDVIEEAIKVEPIKEEEDR